MNFQLIINMVSVLADIATLILLFFTLLQLRLMNKDREVGLTIRVFDRFGEPVFVSAYDYISKNNSSEFFEKIDPFSDDGRKIRKVAIVFEEVGILLQTKAIDKDLILSLVSSITINTWKLLEKFIKKERKRLNDITLLDNFEYLYNESINFIKNKNELHP